MHILQYISQYTCGLQNKSDARSQSPNLAVPELKLPCWISKTLLTISFIAQIYIRVVFVHWPFISLLITANQLVDSTISKCPWQKVALHDCCIVMFSLATELP